MSREEPGDWVPTRRSFEQEGKKKRGRKNLPVRPASAARSVKPILTDSKKRIGRKGLKRQGCEGILVKINGKGGMKKVDKKKKRGTRGEEVKE